MVPEISPSCLLAILLLGTFLESGYAQVPEVTILQGTIQGTTLFTNHDRNISGFFGIPYGRPPFGEYRFSAPVAADAWNTTLNATDDSNMCTQVRGDEILGKEDCLYLNVFTPQLPENVNSTLLPVMVFIHGGKFDSGSKSSLMSGPEHLLDQDVILVVPNYRLGPLGFLSTGDEVAPGNWGLKDIVLALQWVQNNIANFSGDPDAVTIFGQGAGGGAVQLLTLSDLAAGLFHRSIMQSGSALSPITYRPRAAAVNQTVQLGQYFDCPTNTSISLLNCLREFNSSEIVNTTLIFLVWENFPETYWGPTDEPNIEGALITDTPANLLAAGNGRNLSQMIGVNRDEGIIPRFLDNSELFQSVLENFHEVIPYILQTTYQYDNLTAYAEVLKSYYLNDLTADRSILLSNFTDLLADASFFHPVYSGLQIQLANAASPQYFYTFEYLGNYSSTYGVVHGEELVYLFPQSEALHGTGKVLNGTDLDMVDIMVKLWTSFAINGTPAITASNNTATWEPYSSLNNHLRIGNNSDVEIGMEYSFHNERMQFWEDLFSLISTTEETQAVQSAAVSLLSNIFPLLTLVTHLTIYL